MTSLAHKKMTQEIQDIAYAKPAGRDYAMMQNAVKESLKEYQCLGGWRNESLEHDLADTLYQSAMAGHRLRYEDIKKHEKVLFSLILTQANPWNFNGNKSLLSRKFSETLDDGEKPVSREHISRLDRMVVEELAPQLGYEASSIDCLDPTSREDRRAGYIGKKVECPADAQDLAGRILSKYKGRELLTQDNVWNSLEDVLGKYFNEDMMGKRMISALIKGIPDLSRKLAERINNGHYERAPGERGLIETAARVGYKLIEEGRLNPRAFSYEFRSAVLKNELEKNSYDAGRTAKSLGISERTMKRKMDRYSIGIHESSCYEFAGNGAGEAGTPEAGMERDEGRAKMHEMPDSDTQTTTRSESRAEGRKGERREWDEREEWGREAEERDRQHFDELIRGLRLVESPNRRPDSGILTGALHGAGSPSAKKSIQALTGQSR